MDLKGKRFVNANGKISVVKDTFENITIFEDGTKVDTRLLMNPDYYTVMPSGPRRDAPNILKQPILEQISVDRDRIDPNAFFNQRYSIAQEAEGQHTPQRQVESYNVDNNGITTHFDEEAEREEILRRNRHLMEQRDIQVAKQATQFKNNNGGIVGKILEEEEGIKIENVMVPPSPELYQEQLARRTSAVQLDPVMNNGINNSFLDPMVAIFKRAKMNTEFKITIEIDKKIPKPAYIELMEESSETSFIEYLATEFTESILRNPSVIKDRIEDELRKLIEPKPKVTKTKSEMTPKKKVVNKTNKVVPPPPTPPEDRVLIEGQEPKKPNR